MHYSDFWAVEDWKAIEYKECRFYGDNEEAFWAANVQIGELTSYKTDINGAKLEKMPITRWITVNEWNRLLKNAGVVIF